MLLRGPCAARRDWPLQSTMPVVLSTLRFTCYGYTRRVTCRDESRVRWVQWASSRFLPLVFQQGEPTPRIAARNNSIARHIAVAQAELTARTRGHAIEE